VVSDPRAGGNPLACGIPKRKDNVPAQATEVLLGEQIARFHLIGACEAEMRAGGLGHVASRPRSMRKRTEEALRLPPPIGVTIARTAATLGRPNQRPHRLDSSFTPAPQLPYRAEPTTVVVR